MTGERPCDRKGTTVAVLDSGTDIVERALAVLDAECRLWADRKRGDPHGGEADPVPDRSHEPPAGAER